MNKIITIEETEGQFISNSNEENRDIKPFI